MLYAGRAPVGFAWVSLRYEHPPKQGTRDIHALISILRIGCRSDAGLAGTREYRPEIQLVMPSLPLVLDREARRRFPVFADLDLKMIADALEDDAGINISSAAR